MRKTWMRAPSCGLVLCMGLGGAVSGQSIDDYGQTRTFDLPASWNGTGDFDDNVVFDDLPDGRLLLVNGPTISVETGVGTGTFSSIGDYTLSPPSFGPGFISVSPDGTRVAIGSAGSGTVSVASTTSPTPGTTVGFSASDSSGVWLDNTSIALTNSAGVEVLNTSSGTVTTIIDNIGGASAGIAFDASGNLYTGNGFDFAPGGPNTGLIKAFDAVDVQAALASGTAIDFQASGVVVADVLSAATLGFDGSGNFFVGGGDFFGSSGDLGYAALIDGDALAARLADPINVPLIDMTSDPSVLRMFDAPQAFIDLQQPPGWVYNDATGELLLGYFEQPQVLVYVIPEPGTVTLLAIAGLAGCCVRGRRDRESR